MSEKSNIDDLFGNLKDFKSKSPASGWANVSEKVFFNNMAANLQRLTVKTGDYLWGNIAKRLLWHNFLHFSYSTFNIFYLAAILVVSSLTFLTFLPNNNLQTHPSSGNLMAMNPDGDNSSVFCNTFTKEEIISTENASKTDPNLNSADETAVEQSSNADTKAEKSSLSTSNKNTLGVSQSNKITHFASKHSKVITVQTKLSQPKFKEQPPIIENTLVLDTFRIFDTIHFYDTLAVIQKNEMKLNEVKKGYSVNFYFASLFGKTNFTSVENPALADTNNSAMHGTMSISGGVEFEMALSQKVFLQTGIGMLKLSEDFSYEQTKMVIDTVVKPYFTSNSFYSYLDKPTYELDTTNIYPVVTYIHHQDGSVTTDTTWYYHVDSVEVIIKDSILVNNNDTSYETIIDTTMQHYFYEYANRYTYLQIPLIFGYKFGKGKLTYTVSGGIINEIFLNAKGRGISFSDAYEVVDVGKEFPFMKYNVSYYLGAGIEYKVEDNISFFAEGFYRKNVNSAFQNSFVLKKRFVIYGIKTGIKVHF